MATVRKTALATGSTSGVREKEVVATVLLHAQSTKAFVTVEQVASLAAYLASNLAGAIIPIEVGWTAQ